MIKFFQRSSPWYPFRFYIIGSLLVIGLLAYANLTGWRLFAGGQQQWNASGPGGHHK